MLDKPKWNRNSKLALVAEGGGIGGGAFSCGVLDYLHDIGLTNFDYVTGNSSSIPNLAYFVAGQFDLAEKIWKSEVPTEEFMNCGTSVWSVFLAAINKKKGLNLDHLVDGIIAGGIDDKKEFKLNFDALVNSDSMFIIPVTNAISGEYQYFQGYDEATFYKLIKATMTLPFALTGHVDLGVEPVTIGVREYKEGLFAFPTVVENFQSFFDGKYIDPIPIIEEEFGEEIYHIFILTSPAKNCEPSNIDRDLLRFTRAVDYLPFILKNKKVKIPEGLPIAIKNQRNVYKERIKMVEELEANGKALVIRPDCGLVHFNNDQYYVDKVFRAGVLAAQSNDKLRDIVESLIDYSNTNQRYFARSFL